ncbi:MAG: hypothetical protein HYV07_02185 [Deltaproteobacteria bacterium]|nr:hypothetical protein [Deltaproteobacteria bacterium]
MREDRCVRHDLVDHCRAVGALAAEVLALFDQGPRELEASWAQTLRRKRGRPDLRELDNALDATLSSRHGS